MGGIARTKLTDKQKKPDWMAIRNEYLTTGIAYRPLAEKYGVSLSTLSKRAKKEGWVKKRDKTCDKIETKVIQKTQDAIVDKELNRIEKIYLVSDKLLEKLDRAVDELDLHLVTNKTRTRVIEYKDEKAIGKPTKEVIEDVEEILQLAGIVDRSGLKSIASALKDIKDVQTTLDGGTNQKLNDTNILEAIRGTSTDIFEDDPEPWDDDEED